MSTSLKLSASVRRYREESQPERRVVAARILLIVPRMFPASKGHKLPNQIHRS
jgi:hypothetical protein